MSVLSVLNNAKDKSYIPMKLKPKADYSESGSVIYPRNTLIYFEGKISTNRTLVNKVFGESLDRDNSFFVIITVNQLPFKKDDIVIDDMGKEYVIVETTTELATEQHFLKSGYQSKRWLLGVQGDE